MNLFAPRSAEARRFFLHLENLAPYYFDRIASAAATMDITTRVI